MQSVAQPGVWGGCSFEDVPEASSANPGLLCEEPGVESTENLEGVSPARG